jgi:hypothetical protein
MSKKLNERNSSIMEKIENTSEKIMNLLNEQNTITITNQIFQNMEIMITSQMKEEVKQNEIIKHIQMNNQQINSSEAEIQKNLESMSQNIVYKINKNQENEIVTMMRKMMKMEITNCVKILKESMGNIDYTLEEGNKKEMGILNDQGEALGVKLDGITNLIENNSIIVNKTCKKPKGMFQLLI